MFKRAADLSDRKTMQWLPVALLAASGAAAAVLILYLNRSGSFYYDEWDWFAGAAQLDAAKLFESDNGHLVLVPRLIYQAVLSVFGTHYWPFMVINLALVVAVSVLFFLLARKRVGDWIALVPAIFFLFFGSAWDVLVTSVGINANLAIACGLGAFLALERRTLAADLLAGGLVTVGLASQSGEVAIALGGIMLLVGQGRWRRSWVMAIPLALFGLWNALAERSGGASVTVESLGGLSHSLFDSVSAAMASVTGVFPAGFPTGLGEIDITAGRPLAAIAILALFYVLVRLQRVTPRFLAYSTVVMIFWVTVGVSARNPGTGRYSLVTLPFIFLAVFELLAGRQVRWRVWVAVGAVLALGLIANLNALRNGAAILRYHGAGDRGAVTALELQAARIEAHPEFPEYAVSYLVASPQPYGSDMIYVTAGEYLEAAEEFGSAGYTGTKIETAPAPARETADRLLLSVLEPRFVPPTPRIGTGRSGCETLPADSGPLVIPPRGLTLRASSAKAKVMLRRFFELPTGTVVLPAGAEGTLALPGDEVPRPWTAEVASAAPVVACPPPQ